MSTRGRQLCFVAIVPPEPVLTEVRAFKEIADARFDSRRALRSPAHITLIPPFWADEETYVRCVATLNSAVREGSPFQIVLAGFDVFKPRVIFVNVVQSKVLTTFQAKVSVLMTALLDLEPPGRPFHPHMTVAFKDLHQSKFREAWEYFSAIEYDRTFTVRDIELLRHEKSGWKIVDRFSLQDQA